MHEPTPPSLGIIVLELVRHEVRFVVIGAWAAQAHGVELPDPTQDVDFTPDADPENLDRLSAALHALGARIRVADVPEGLAFDHSGESLARASDS